jgi:putative transposase
VFIRVAGVLHCNTDYDAACEGFFSRQKNELSFARDWVSTTVDEFTAALDAYIRWYNEARIKISMGSMSPIEHRKSLGFAN